MAAVLNSCATSNTISHDISFKSFEGYHLKPVTPLPTSTSLTIDLGSQQYLQQLQFHDFTAAMYPSLPKYHRSSAQQQIAIHNHHVTGYSNHHANNVVSHHQFNTSSLAYGMPVSSGYSSQHSTLQKSYPSASVQRSSSSAESCRNYWGHSHPTSSALYRNDRHQTKRKSAVELLAESKPFFVKTENILERANFGASTLVCSGKRDRNGSSVILDEGKYNPSYGETTFTAAEAERRYGTTTAHRRSSHIHQHHHGNHAAQQCHTTSANTSMYHGKFRMSLSSEGSQERDKLARYRKENYAEPIILNETKSVSFEEDVTFRIPPPLYFSPQNYNNMYDSGDEPLVLTENYRPISPPAEYAEDSTESHNDTRPRYNYQRSYSHSHEAKYTATSHNINSHKSLPDLHTQINRHSPHSEILSCCSRGNRSIKSAGESSLNRDSGGSSGHYTHRSEPCYRQHRVELDRDERIKKCCSATTRVEYRRDSGSSTQHSNNSYCGYSCKAMNENFDSPDYLFNFTTPEVPEAFQDDYIPPSPRYQSDDTRYYSSSAHPTHVGHQSYIKHKASSDEPIVQSPGSQPSLEDISPPPIQFKRQKCIRFKRHNRISLPAQPSASPHSTNDHSHTSPMDIYRRSEHLRYFFPKCFSADDYQQQHLLSTQQQHPHSQSQQQTSQKAPAPQQHMSQQQQIREFRDQYANQALRRSHELLLTPSEPLMDLEKFFDRLGLNDDKFHEIYTFSKRKHSNGSSDGSNSTVFFSDVSTVDSMRLPDSSETQSQAAQTYRPTEPPSIVERNARIIKWLCNIRKVQNDGN